MGVLGFRPDERDDGAEGLEDRVVTEDFPNQSDHIGVGKDRRGAQAAGEVERDHETLVADLQGILGLMICYVASVSVVEFVVQTPDRIFGKDVIEDCVAMSCKAIGRRANLLGLCECVGRDALAVDSYHAYRLRLRYGCINHRGSQSVVQ